MFPRGGAGRDRRRDRVGLGAVNLPRRAAGVASCGVLLTVVALAFDVAPLLVPGVAFTAIGLLTPAFVWLTARGTDVRRLPGQTEAVEGVRFFSIVEVRSGPLGLRGGELRDPLGGRPFPVALAPAPNGRAAQIEIELSFSRRGRKRVEPPELHIRDPLGLAPLVRVREETQEILILPRTEPVSWHSRAGMGARNALEHGSLADALDASDIDGLRPYRPGTPASRIHWPAVARGAGLLERRMRADHEARPLVVLDCRSAEDAETRLDAAVRAAASLVLELARLGGCGLLAGADARILEVDARLNGWSAARTRLALVQAASRPPALAARRRPGALFYVAADASARPPQVLRDTGTMLVLPATVPPPGGWPVRFRVAGCVGYALGYRRHDLEPSEREETVV
jgi:uncharacterized protein (DUF58 family)